jgi:cathepsin X
MRLLRAAAVGTIIALAEGRHKCKKKSSKLSDPDDPSDDIPDVIKSPLPHTYIQAAELPREFDWRNVNGVSYVTTDLNQHAPVYCGSCWLHGGISTLNDRLKIARNAQFPEINLARQVVLNCGGDLAGSCDGGGDRGLYVFTHQEGLPSEDCQPYSALSDFKCSPFRNCMNCEPPTDEAPLGICYPVQSYNRYFVTEYGTMLNPSIHEMKAEIFKRGPISCSIDCSTITHGSYHAGDIVTSSLPTSGEWDLDHVISVAGWGYDKEKDLEYWVVRNSWGTFWGDQGWFKVVMGNNTIGIESECNWAVMDPVPVRANFGPADVSREFASADKSPGKDELRTAAKVFGFVENPLEVVPEHPPKWETDDMHKSLHEIEHKRPMMPENRVHIV